MKLAVVIPWFGRDLKGGAEQQAWQIASRLGARGHAINVLTTCCRSHQDDWATNHWPAGSVTEPEGFVVRRFPVEERDRRSFDQVCSRLLSLPPEALVPGVSPLPPNESRIFVAELIKSNALLTFLTTERENFDWFIFLPYLYGPILDGIPIVGDRAALQPCLHDEAYAYLPEVADAFYRAALLFFNSEGERELALRLFGPGIYEKCHLVGEGVEEKASASHTAFEANGEASPGRYVLYLGRKDEGKNLPLLLRAFRRFRAVRPNSDLKLLLAGHGSADLELQDSGTVEDLGVVSDARKEQLLRQCTALFQPSQKESFSRVMMEAWMHGKPVGAHRRCLATAIAVERSGGGWVAETEEEWASLFTAVHQLPPQTLEELGWRGRHYAEDFADWNHVVERYEAALSTPNNALTHSSKGTQINQFLPNLSYGDAISNYAIWIRDQLRALGFGSGIYVRFIDPLVAHECGMFSLDALETSDAAIYHHSIGSEITPHLLSFDRPKCLIYHNITPAEFLEPYRPDFAQILRQGRADLGKLTAHFPISCGDSTFNTLELKARGFRTPSVAPIPVDPRKWNFPPDEKLMTELQDGRTNILFVGRVAPNKKQDDLLRAFARYLDFDPTARLIIAGKLEENDPYSAHLIDLVQGLNLEDVVVFTDRIADAQLAAYYRTAHLFWSMSEHEGFCVPLVEAMWFDVPVLAHRSSAIPETLGDAGLMFSEKDKLGELAALAHLLITDRVLRRKIVTAQRTQRLVFLPDAVRPILQQVVKELVASVPVAHEQSSA